MFHCVTNRHNRPMTKHITRLYIDAGLREQFRKQFPMKTSMSWLLELAMREVLALTDGQPDLETIVASAVRSAALRERLASRARANAKQPKHPVTIERIGTDSTTVLGSNRKDD